MSDVIAKIITGLVFVFIGLYVMHLFNVGGFGTTFGMIVDDVRFLAKCPSKPGIVFEFLLRGEAEEYSYFAKNTNEMFPFTTVNINGEGAFDAICDSKASPPSRIN